MKIVFTIIFAIIIFNFGVAVYNQINVGYVGNGAAVTKNGNCRIVWTLHKIGKLNENSDFENKCKIMYEYLNGRDFEKDVKSLTTTEKKVEFINNVWKLCKNLIDCGQAKENGDPGYIRKLKHACNKLSELAGESGLENKINGYFKYNLARSIQYDEKYW